MYKPHHHYKGDDLSRSEKVERKVLEIVGTKNATSVLKDGDRVEVNAITGVVKFIQ
jgi:hypothetical protein